jgi:hypothetical protein
VYRALAYKAYLVPRLDVDDDGGGGGGGGGGGDISLCLIKHHAEKSYEGVEVKLHARLTSRLHAFMSSLSRSGSLSIGQIFWYPLDRRLIGPQTPFRPSGEEKNPRRQYNTNLAARSQREQ